MEGLSSTGPTPSSIIKYVIHLRLGLDIYFMTKTNFEQPMDSLML